MIKKSLCGLTVSEIFELIEPFGFSLAHAVLIANSIYKKRTSDILHIAKIPFKLREELFKIATTGIYPPQASEVSADKSVKYLFTTESGKKIETVFIPDKKRNTVCVSSQSGCRMGCSFCVTARYGFKGNLTAGEIVNQILAIPQADKVTHIVFMGMGEPMDNLENVLKACNILIAEWGLSISAGNITVSTVGIMPGVEQFLYRTECNLTLSLYSTNVKERQNVIPAEKQYPVHNIIEIMKNFGVRKKRRLSLAYVMIQGINDSDLHLEGLKSILTGSGLRVNLLSYHKAGNDDQCSSTEERMQFFKHNLIISGISASIRKSRGTDISAACGLLASGLKQ